MIKVQSQRGEISISSAVFTSITGAAATNCFGVKGMAYRSMTDGLVHLLRREAMSKGVKVTYNHRAAHHRGERCEYRHGMPLHYGRGQICGHQKYRRGGP